MRDRGRKENSEGVDVGGRYTTPASQEERGRGWRAWRHEITHITLIPRAAGHVKTMSVPYRALRRVRPEPRIKWLSHVLMLRCPLFVLRRAAALCRIMLRIARQKYRSAPGRM